MQVPLVLYGANRLKFPQVETTTGREGEKPEHEGRIKTAGLVGVKEKRKQRKRRGKKKSGGRRSSPLDLSKELREY